MFTLDTSIGEFVLTHPNLKIPDRGSIYSMNEANRPFWDPPLRAYVEDLQMGKVRHLSPYPYPYPYPHPHP